VSIDAATTARGLLSQRALVTTALLLVSNLVSKRKTSRSHQVVLMQTFVEQRFFVVGETGLEPVTPSL